MKILLKSNVTPDYNIDSNKPSTALGKWIKKFTQPYVEYTPEGLLKNTTFIYAPEGKPDNGIIKLVAYGILTLIVFSLIYTIFYGVIKK